MKTMLLFKKMDVYGQMVMITGGFLFAFACQNLPAFYAYFFVGGWQVVSAFLNFIYAKKFPLASERKQYQIIVVVVAIVAITSVVSEIILFILLLCLFFLSPLLAIWYNHISYKELKNWEARELVHFR